MLFAESLSTVNYANVKYDLADWKVETCRRDGWYALRDRGGCARPAAGFAQYSGILW